MIYRKLIKKKSTEKRIAMNLQNNFTKPNKILQEVLEKWDKKYFLFYQKTWMGLQKNRGCTKKERGTSCIRFIKNVIFICMFQYFFPCPCCRCLCTWDIRYFWYFMEKTFPESILFFIWNPALPVTIIPSKTRHVWFWKDKKCTPVGCFCCPPGWEKAGATAYIHMCYSLNQDRMYGVKVTDQHTAESLTHFSLKKDDIVMADTSVIAKHLSVLKFENIMDCSAHNILSTLSSFYFLSTVQVIQPHPFLYLPQFQQASF